ncbi:hypothetical protein TanjilG_01682 [Lupinus angustifolius]|nr:hypothetical protein TanjilG_01682 [Lupinus angustifolius]
MPTQKIRPSIEEESRKSQPSFDKRSGYDSRTSIYHPLDTFDTKHEISTRLDINTASLVLSQFPQGDLAEATLAFIDSGNNQNISYGELSRSTYSLAKALYHSLEIRKGDVVLVLSPNSILYPSICLAVLSIGAILTLASPLNTDSEIAKKVHNSGAKLAIAAPEELHKLVPTGVPTLLTTHPSDGKMRTVEELIKGCYNSLELPQVHVLQSDTAAILYSSGTTGVSKGIVLTHANLIFGIRILCWFIYAMESQDDVFLAFLPMVEDEETGQILMAYVVRAAGSELSEDQVIQSVAGQVAPYKKVRRVSFIETIPRTDGGKILLKDLVSLSKHQIS